MISACLLAIATYGDCIGARSYMKTPYVIIVT